MNKLKKLSVVTGGGSGIGLAITEKFIEAGITTVVIGRDEKKLNVLESRFGALCKTIAFDLNKLPLIPSLIESIVSDYGGIDILINNAGINQKKNFTEVSDEEFYQVILTNLVSVFSFSREVVKTMLAKNTPGVVVNISSMAAAYGIPRVIAYTASKSAIEGMTRAMATELSPKGIRVNCIAPGFIATDMSRKALDNDPDRLQKVMGRTPMGSLGMPADIGDAALFLVSDAAKYITGIVLPVDGGNSIGF